MGEVVWFELRETPTVRYNSPHPQVLKCAHLVLSCPSPLVPPCRIPISPPCPHGGTNTCRVQVVEVYNPPLSAVVQAPSIDAPPCPGIYHQ